MTTTKESRRRLHLVRDAGPASRAAPAAAAPASYTNRFGDTYYLHQGTTMTGKPRYFVARAIGPRALSAMPDGFEFTETLNGVVSVKRVGGRPSLVPHADVETVRRELASHPRLRRYAADVHKGEIVVYEPEGLLAEQELAELGREFGLRPREMARRLEAHASRTRYAPVMKFAHAFVGAPGVYVASRRHYHGDGGWWMLSHGPLLKLLREYLPVLGTEEFYELL